MTETHLHNPALPILGFVGFSGSGKTTVLAKVINVLNSSGMRIAAIKHAHHHFDIDHPGKDSYVLRHAGAGQTLVASKHRWALMAETPDSLQEPQLSELVARLDQTRLDLILVEGFKHAHFPKLEVHRPSVNPQLLYPRDPDIIALLTDSKSQIQSPGSIPVLDLADTSQIVRLIMNFMGKHNERKNLHGQ